MAMRWLFRAGVLAMTTMLAGGAAAYVVVPAENPAGFHVVVEGDLGDHVPLSALPAPFDRFEPRHWGPAGLVLRWRYFRSTEEGQAVLSDDGMDGVRIEFAFAGRDLADGDTIAGAAVLLGKGGDALHTVYAHARVEGDAFPGGGAIAAAGATLSMPRESHALVTGLVLFNMKYYAIQRLEPDRLETAMRRAVHRVTGGAGTEQWIAAGAGEN